MWWVATLLWIVLSGCGGGGGSGPPPQATPTPVPTATPLPTATPDPIPGPAFDLRGRTFVNNVATAGVTVTVTGSAGAVTPSEQTTSGAGGVYSFFLGAGTYSVRATFGTRTPVTRTVTIPPGGQAVDNFDLRL